MTTKICAKISYLEVVVLLGCLLCRSESSAEVSDRAPVGRDSMWTQENLVAWEAATNDTKARSSEERAQMLERMGFKHYAYLSSSNPWDTLDDVNISQHDIDAEIEAMQRHGIDILAWYFWVNSDNPAEVPKVKEALESFKRHGIHPQIWVTRSFAHYPRDLSEWAKLLPRKFVKFVLPKSYDEFERLPAKEKQAVNKAYIRAEVKLDRSTFPKTAAEQEERVKMEAERIREFVNLAEPYGCRVNIYNHRGWFGLIDNEVAIIHRLNELGVKGVGIVYNFSHSRDAMHDDSKTFPQLWEKMRPYVVAVNVIGLYGINGIGYPSQGDIEFAMMRTIQKSGWKGWVGVAVPKIGDAEVELRNSVTGIDWIAAELQQVGSGGPRPVWVEH